VKRPVRNKAIRRTDAVLTAGFLAALLAPAQPASAQNLFEALFSAFLGGGSQTHSQTDPRGPAASPPQQMGGGLGHGTARFTPIDPSSSEWTRKLSEAKIRPVPPEQAALPFAGNDAALTHDVSHQAAR
jgi:hypothetical protein